MLTESKLADIVYTSESKNETTNRTIVPVSVPKDTIRAIDVTGLTEDAQAEMARLVSEYKEYMANIFRNAFTFENWVEHTYNETVIPKWRTFKVANTQVQTPESD